MIYMILENALDKGDIIKKHNGEFYRYIPGKKRWMNTQTFDAKYIIPGAIYEMEYEELSEEKAMKKIKEQEELFNNLLAKASEIATEAHKNMMDKGGAPYIRHPEWVAEHVEETEGKILGWLHDVLEDTSVTEDDLRAAGFPERIILRLRRLSRKDGQKYSEYIRLVAKDRLTKKVKLADLENNRDISRIPEPQEEDFRRLAKYGYALAYLDLPTSKGNLCQEILAKIDELDS